MKYGDYKEFVEQIKEVFGKPISLGLETKVQSKENCATKSSRLILQQFIQLDGIPEKEAKSMVKACRYSMVETSIKTLLDLEKGNMAIVSDVLQSVVGHASSKSEESSSTPSKTMRPLFLRRITDISKRSNNKESYASVSLV